VEAKLGSCDLLIQGGHVATLSMSAERPYGAVRDGVVAVAEGRIAWVGPVSDAPEALVADPVETLDLNGGWVTPGLIDVHTHLVFAGTRADEFAQRLAGATYEEIARAGGGILSTVRATRSASEEDLQNVSRLRLSEMIDHGVTTLEIKSGYGLDVETELRMLRVARTLAAEEGVSVSTTLLAAHAIAPEFQGDAEGYLDRVCGELLPAAASLGLADACDAFCESIAFSVAQCERVFTVAAGLGLPLRLHADQLSDGGGAALAARVGARSADHLEYTTEAGVRAMAEAGTAAVLLPGAFYVLGETQRPPVAALRREGVRIAVASDLNPGTSPVASPLMAMNLACTQFGLTPEEAVAGMTREAAPVLGLEDRGRIEAGLRADLACWTIEDPAELAYWIGANPCRAVISGGRRLR